MNQKKSKNQFFLLSDFIFFFTLLMFIVFFYWPSLNSNELVHMVVSFIGVLVEAFFMHKVALCPYNLHIRQYNFGQEEEGCE